MSADHLKIKIYNERGTQIVPVTKSTVTIGRAAHCDIVLNHSAVQAEHVRAWLEGGRIWLQDMGSTTGTFLNGTRLPTLKPMLIREVDIIKLGDCPATLGLESNLARTLGVRTISPIPEATLTEIRANDMPRDVEVERRRDELVKVAREFAELKLQLQMARLDRNAGDDLRKQLNGLREEIRQASGQRDRLKQNLTQLQSERDTGLREAAEEIARKLEAAEHEIKEMRDSAGRKLGHWKVDMAAELSRSFRDMTESKAKAWITRPLSKDMMFEWESEVNAAVRRVLLDEKAHAATGGVDMTRTFALSQVNVPVASVPVAPAAVGAAVAESGIRLSSVDAEATMIGGVALTPETGVRRFRLNKYSAGAMGALVLIVGFAAYRLSSGKASVPRGYASQGSPMGAVPPPPAVPVAYHPMQTPDFKKTFVDNVLFTKNYNEIEANADFHRKWVSELTLVARDQWHLSQGAIEVLITKETTLLHDLGRAREGLSGGTLMPVMNRMRPVEAAFRTEMMALLGNSKAYDTFFAFKKIVYERNRTFIKVR